MDTNVWEVGFATNDGENTTFAHGLTFRDALERLRREVQKQQLRVSESEMFDLKETEDDITVILEDSGIVDDPDQWEDQEFWHDDGHYYLIED